MLYRDGLVSSQSLAIFLEIETWLVEFGLNLPNVDALTLELGVYLNRQLDPLIDLDSLVGLPIKLGSSPDEACTNQLAGHQLRALILRG